MFSFIFLVFSFWFLLFATHSRKLGTKFPKFFKATELFETRITRMVTNLMTVESIGFDQFVVRERSRWDRRHRRQSRDGKRRASREASEFQISCRGCRRLKGFAFLAYFGGRKIIHSRFLLR